jgi:hypothetical protein
MGSMDQPRPPLFCDTGLASRIERADARLIAEAAEAGRQRGAEGLVWPLAGGVAVWNRPGSPLNKVAGLGFAGLPDPLELAALERAFDERRAALRVELSSLAEAGLAATFAERGYHLRGFENVLGRRLPIEASDLAIAPGVAMSECRSDDLPSWTEVMIGGFSDPDTQGVPSGEQYPRSLIEDVFADMLASSGIVTYLARRDGELAGAATLRLSDGIAQLTGAATVAAHRRRGVHTSLLVARLARATLGGCDVAVVTTEPGSRSQENVQRRGFDLLYTRAIMVREPR